MASQINLFILLFGALQGGLLSLWFLKNRRREPAHLYMALFLMVVGIQLTLKSIAKVWMFHTVPFLYLLSYQMPLLVGPLLFLYARAGQNRRFKRADALHFVPFGLSVAGVGLTLLTDGAWREAHPWLRAAVQLVFLGVYAVLARRRADRPVKRFVSVAAAAEAVIIVTLALMVLYNGRFPDVRLLFVALTLLIYWVSYQVISETGPFARPEPASGNSKGYRVPKYAHSSLKSEEADRIERELLRLMAQEKIYLDPELTNDLLAAKLGTTRHHLSQVLNERLQKTYADYMNGLRLEEALRRLSDPADYRFTIMAIAFDSGFNSIATFNEAFRKRYGTTPSLFRKSSLKQARPEDSRRTG
ncbi:helix-turn-helix domain-containing protein [Larkinella soli]|uniref:helix-turn-helix domain-containing protein n=1 Tax=Larkinella soli TaxID=1770527 RepID=UPI000FFB8D65|nr:helix-turn-helix domain-containing protein [Larkinella soli]